MSKRFLLPQWLCKVAYKLGLMFKDPVMESSYIKFKSEVEGKVLSVTNTAAIVITAWNLILGIVGTKTHFEFRGTLVGLAVVAILAKFKLPAVSKLVLLGTVSALYYFIMTMFKKFSPTCVPETYYLVGNQYAFSEAIVMLSLKDLKLKVMVTIINQALKMVLLFDGSKTTLSGQTGMTFIWIIFFISYETVERKYYQVIYESREQLKKFQDLLSNDFPSSVLVMSSDFRSILYSNHFFNNKFGGDHHPDFVLSVFEKFQIDTISPSFDSQHYGSQSLNDFVKQIARKIITIPLKEVMTLSTAFNSSENNTLHYEIKLRQISWGSQDSFALIFNDVSDKQLVMALKIADAHKDQIIATVSHELRTPINGILGILEIISSKVTDQFIQTYLGYSKSCSKLLLYLVNSLLDLSQIRHNQLKIEKNNFRLDIFLEELKSLYVFQAQEKNIEFVISQQELPEEIYTDKYRLIEILINLIGNAFKFTFKGKIELSISRDTTNQDNLVFSVEDTGVGIKEEDKPKLFTMFGRLNQENKNINAHGVGLGLTTANELVKALNDDNLAEMISFESEYGKGTKFSFRIPVVEKIENPVLDSSASCDYRASSDEFISDLTQHQRPLELRSMRYQSLSTPGLRTQQNEKLAKSDLFRMSTQSNNTITYHKSHKHVLLVDDNPFNLLTASFLLEKLNYTVTKAMSGEECLRLLKEGKRVGTYYDLVLMDIQMPIMDGLEACKIIRSMIKKKELASMPIVALTANEKNQKNLASYSECGFTDYLSKPLKEEDLSAVLRKWVKST